MTDLPLANCLLTFLSSLNPTKSRRLFKASLHGVKQKGVLTISKENLAGKIIQEKYTFPRPREVGSWGNSGQNSGIEVKVGILARFSQVVCLYCSNPSDNC